MLIKYIFFVWLLFSLALQAGKTKVALPALGDMFPAQKPSATAQLQSTVVIENGTAMKLFAFVRGAKPATTLGGGLAQAGIIAAILPPHSFAISLSWPVVEIVDAGMSYQFAQASKTPCIITAKALPKIDKWLQTGGNRAEIPPGLPGYTPLPANPSTKLTFESLDPVKVGYWSGQVFSTFTSNQNAYIKSQGIYCIPLGWFGGTGNLGTWIVTQDQAGDLIFTKK